MARFKFHKIAAVAVLIGFVGWTATGEFSSVGSAAPDAEAEVKKPEAAPVVKRTVGVVTPPRINHARSIRISGLTEADKRAVLATRVSGVIAELPIHQGDRVKAGDMILTLDAEEKTAAVETARQLLAQREAESTASARLVKSGTLGKLQLDTARSQLAAAQSALETAQAELDRNQIKAPFDGLIDRVPVEMGSAVMQGSEVATILDLDPILGKGEVSERDLRYLKIGDEADVRLVNGEMVTGKLRYISRDASSATRTFRIEIAIPNGDGRIPAGMTAEITLRAEAAEAIVLPRSVVTLNADGDLGVRAVDKDNKVLFYPIDLVDDTPNGLVLAGIPADARVIVAGQDLVADGDVVNAVEPDPETMKKLIDEATKTQ